MLAVLAHGLAALAAGFTSFFGCEFVRGAFFVRGATAHARDLALLLLVHCRKSPRPSVRHSSSSTQHRAWMQDIREHRTCDENAPEHSAPTLTGRARLSLMHHLCQGRHRPAEYR